MITKIEIVEQTVRINDMFCKFTPSKKVRHEY